MNKKYVAVVASIVVAIVAIAVVAFVVLSSLFAPPVDISGINLSATSSSYELLPLVVAGKHLDEGSSFTVPLAVDTGIRTFEVERTRATYDGTFVHVFKADSTSDASDTLAVLVADVNWFGDASSYTQTSDWFTANKDDRSAFFWQSGTLMFGIDAVDENTRNNAAEDLVQYLRSLSD